MTGDEWKLEAAIRYYSEAKNTIHYIDPALINDFESIESFDFKIPHTINKIINGKRVEVPIQVFAISDNREELQQPSKRRVFDNRTASDVLEAIFEARERAKLKEGQELKKVAKKNEGTPNVKKGTSATNKEEAKGIKALQKKIKEDAKEVSKLADKDILERRLRKLQERSKLRTADDCTEKEELQKKIFDMQEELLLKRQEVEALMKNYDGQLDNLKKKAEDNQVALKQSKTVIQNLLEEKEKLKAQAKSVLSVSDFSACGRDNDNSSEMHFDITKSSTLNPVVAVGPSSKEKTPDPVIEESSVIMYNPENLPSSPPKSNSSFHPNDDSGDSFEKRKQLNRSSGSGLMNEDSDQRKDKDIAIKNLKRKNPKKYTDDSSSDEDNTNSREKRKKKKLPKAQKKKYLISSDEECSNADGKSKPYSRQSDDEYLSDFFDENDPKKRENFKSFKNKKGVRMCHLKHGVSITYDAWDRVKQLKDLRECMRILLKALYKEEELMNKTFKLSSCKTERIPGQTRSVFSRRKIAAIRKTFFLRVDKVYPNKRKDQDFHKDNWKSYISEYINSLVEKEKRMLEKKRKAEQTKQAAKEAAAHAALNDSFSFSSDDEEA